MIRSTVSKMMWVGRATVFLVGLAVLGALVLGLASMALGANGRPFILGENNAATALSRLTGNVNGSAVQIRNNNAGANDSALSLQVQQGEAPMRVNSDAKVANLNADKVDNLNPSQIKGAKAYAVVIPDGPSFLDEGRTSGFTSVERITTGEYCLRAPGLSPSNRPPVVSVDWFHTGAPQGTASAMAHTGGCDNGGFFVVTKRVALSGGSLTDTASDTVGFVIAVP